MFSWGPHAGGIARARPSRPTLAALSNNPIAPGVACALVFALRSVIAAISRRTSSTMACSRSLWRRLRQRSTRWFALRATRQSNANDTPTSNGHPIYEFVKQQLDVHEIIAMGVGGRGRQPLNPARGPLAVSLPYGVSLLSVGERGGTPCRRPTR